MNENPKRAQTHERKERKLNGEYDAIVLGGGAAGEHYAGALPDSGFDVAIVERELAGGECSYRVRIPSKALPRPGEAVDAALMVAGGAQAIGGNPDLRAALGWRDYMVSGYDDSGQVKWSEDTRVELIRGSRRIAEPGVAEVDGRRYHARRTVIATRRRSPAELRRRRRRSDRQSAHRAVSRLALTVANPGMTVDFPRDGVLLKRTRAASRCRRLELQHRRQP